MIGNLPKIGSINSTLAGLLLEFIFPYFLFYKKYNREGRITRIEVTGDIVAASAVFKQAGKYYSSFNLSTY